MKNSNSTNFFQQSSKDNSKRYEPLMLAGQSNQRPQKSSSSKALNYRNKSDRSNQGNYFTNSQQNMYMKQNSYNQDQQTNKMNYGDKFKTPSEHAAQSNNNGNNSNQGSNYNLQQSKTPTQRMNKNNKTIMNPQKYINQSSKNNGQNSSGQNFQPSSRVQTTQSSHNNYNQGDITPKGSKNIHNSNHYFASSNANNSTLNNNNNQQGNSINTNKNGSNNSISYMYSQYGYGKKISKNDLSLPPLEGQNQSNQNGNNQNLTQPDDQVQDENTATNQQNPTTPQNHKDGSTPKQSRKLVNSRKSLNRIIKQGYQPGNNGQSGGSSRGQQQNGIGMSTTGVRTPLQSNMKNNNSGLQGAAQSYFRGGSYSQQQLKGQKMAGNLSEVNRSGNYSNSSFNNNVNLSSNVNPGQNGQFLSQTPKGPQPQFYLGKTYSQTPTGKQQQNRLAQNHTNKLSESVNTQNSGNLASNSTLDNEEELLPYNQIPQLEVSKISQKNLGIITCYSANTHQGLVRNYNEDRVSIILNMMKPQNKQELTHWPTCSFFGIYDGHGGQTCSEFLRDNLHYFIIKDEYFPQDPHKAILRGFEKAENEWTERADKEDNLDRAGSCAIVAMLVDNMCYAVNLGDSRAVLSEQGGKIVTDLSTDHKPSEPGEEQRIVSLGGKIYQSQIPVGVNARTGQQQVIKGPYRVLPGRLAVSRTIGDSEAKLSKYGGIKNVISSEPDIISFKIKDEHDFVMLACDGVFDKMTNKEVIDTCWSVAPGQKNQHEFVGKAIEQVMRLSMMRKSFDNITCVVIGLKNVETVINGQKQQIKYQNQQQQNQNQSMEQKQKQYGYQSTMPQQKK